jgi:AcrR family transcriptional regulator
MSAGSSIGEEAPVEGLDGRQSRTARSRLAICDACIDLVQEGNLQPSADQVAKRAGVSRRSIFNHFGDLAELYDAVVEVGLRRSAPLLVEISEEAPVAERLERLIEARTDFLEAAGMFTRALTAQALVGTTSEQAVRISAIALAQQHAEVERLFAGELDALTPGERAEVLAALSAALAPLLWETLRGVGGHSVAGARGVVHRMLRAVLRDAGVAL